MKRYRQANENIHASEELKEKAARPGQKRPYARWTGAVAAVLAVVLIGGIAMWPGKAQPSANNPNGPALFSLEGGSRMAGRSAAQATALSVAKYPEMHPYPREENFYSGKNVDWEKASKAYSDAYDAWWKDRDALRSGTDYTGVMDDFISRSTAQFLTDAGEENRVYSPLNVYMALSMLAETTGDNTRAQILDLLQVGSIEELRERANALWLDHYQALRDWINEQTNGLLEEQASQLKMEPETVLALASTIYFKAAWHDEFGKENTETDTFHALSGDVDAEFMRQTLESTFYWGDNFTAVQLRFQEGGSMWLILPAEGCSVGVPPLPQIRPV